MLEVAEDVVPQRVQQAHWLSGSSAECVRTLMYLAPRMRLCGPGAISERHIVIRLEHFLERGENTRQVARQQCRRVEVQSRKCAAARDPIGACQQRLVLNPRAGRTSPGAARTIQP